MENVGKEGPSPKFPQGSEQRITEKIGKYTFTEEGDFAPQSASGVAQSRGKVINKISDGGRAILRGLSKVKTGAKSLASKVLPAVTRSNAHYRSRLSQEGIYAEPPSSRDFTEDDENKETQTLSEHREIQETFDERNKQIVEEVEKEVKPRSSRAGRLLKNVSLGIGESKEGAFGAVAKLRFETLEKNLAFKVPRGTPVQEREIEVVEHLIGQGKIPGVLRCRAVLNLEFGQVIVAKWASEGDLEGYLNKVKDEKEKIRLLGLGARSLDALHMTGVIHHDVKLNNILVHIKGKKEEKEEVRPQSSLLQAPQKLEEKKKTDKIEAYLGDFGCASIRSKNSPPGHVNFLHCPPEITRESRDRIVDWNNTAYDSWMLGLMIVQSLGNCKDEDLPWKGAQKELVRLIGNYFKKMEGVKHEDLEKQGQKLSDLKSDLSWIDGIQMNPKTKELAKRLMDPDPDKRPPLEYAAKELERLSK